MWQISIELRYQHEETIPKGYDEDNHYRVQQNIFDYIMYFLVLLLGLLSEVAVTGNIRSRDIMAEADKCFHGRHIKNKRDVKLGSKTILDVSNDVDLKEVKRDCSKSMFDAGLVAKVLI